MATLYRRLAILTIPLGLTRGTVSSEAAARMRAILEAPKELAARGGSEKALDA
jgi:hypothetical protein